MGIGAVSSANAGMSQYANPVWAQQSEMLLQTAEGIQGDVELLGCVTQLLKSINHISKASVMNPVEAMKLIESKFDSLVAYIEAASPEMLEELQEAMGHKKSKRKATTTMGAEAYGVLPSQFMASSLGVSEGGSQSLMGVSLNTVAKHTGMAPSDVAKSTSNQVEGSLSESAELLLEMIYDLIMDGVQDLGEIQMIMGLLGHLGMHIDIALVMPDLLDTIKQEILKFVESAARSATSVEEIRSLIESINQMAAEATGGPIISSSEEEMFVEMVRELTSELPDSKSSQIFSTDIVTEAPVETRKDDFTRDMKEDVLIASRFASAKIKSTQSIEHAAGVQATQVSSVQAAEKGSGEQSDSDSDSGQSAKENVEMMLAFADNLVRFMAEDSLDDIESVLEELNKQAGL